MECAAYCKFALPLLVSYECAKGRDTDTSHGQEIKMLQLNISVGVDCVTYYKNFNTSC